METTGALRPRWPERPSGLAFGGDYNPEQWPESVWLEDVALMRQAKVNLVTVGVFAWSRLQPNPTAWDFAWLVRVLDLLHDSGIAVDLATATASPPPWFSRRHPESLPVTETGTRLEIGSRQHVCPSSTAFRAAAAALVDRLATHVGKHPAVVMWHVSNEYGDHVRQCFCQASAAAFRGWLIERYVTLEVLNEAWTTDVWGNRYGAWAEIMPPRSAPGPRNPAQVVDWRRFSSDALLACFESEQGILRRITPDLPVTTNFMRLNDGIDHWRFAAAQDVISADLYPDPAEQTSLEDVALSHDLMRSFGAGRPWLLMEQARSAVDWRPVNVPRRAEVLRAASIEAVARGADGVLFFQWRGARSGAEAFHSAMLPVGGPTSHGWEATMSLGADLARLAEVAGSRILASTAILVAWDCWWSLDQEGHPSDLLRFSEQALRFYRPLRSRGIALDLRSPVEDLSAYRLVVAPNLFMLEAHSARTLERFVRDGGVLVVGPFSGVVDANYHIPSGHYPALLRDLIGLHWEEVWPMTGPDVGVRFASGDHARARIWREAIELDEAIAVATYEEGELAGWPAVTRRVLGSGVVWYLGCVLDNAGMSTVLGRAVEAAGVAPAAEVPEHVIVSRREAQNAYYLFYVNHSTTASDVVLPADGYELLTNTVFRSGHKVRLEPWGAAVVRMSR